MAGHCSGDQGCFRSPGFALRWRAGRHRCDAARPAPPTRYWPPIVDPPTHTWNPGRWIWADLVTSGRGRGRWFLWEGLRLDRTRPTAATTTSTRTRSCSRDKLPIRRNGLRCPSDEGQGSLREMDRVRLGRPTSRRPRPACRSHGGKVVLAPKRLGERGDTAIFQDPEGTLFGAIHAASGDPPNYPG